jgi:hypothetical protein
VSFQLHCSLAWLTHLRPCGALFHGMGQPQVTANLVDATGKLMKLPMDFSDAGAFASEFLAAANSKRGLYGSSPPVCLTYQMSSVSQPSFVSTIATRALDKALKPTAFLADPGLLDIVRFKSLRNTEGLEVGTLCAPVAQGGSSHPIGGDGAGVAC